MIRPILASTLAALALAAPAAAEQVDVTSQAKAARAEFLLSAIPPTPAAAICMVDTGVNVNPDTSSVIARLKVSGQATDQSPTWHGTQIAMFIGAQANRYGMVGLWPAARVVSIRANVPGQDTFIASDYIDGFKRCYDTAAVYGTKVIALALSSNVALTTEDATVLQEEVDVARASGISVVAAAGNSNGQPVEYAREPAGDPFGRSLELGLRQSVPVHCNRREDRCARLPTRRRGP